MQMKLITSKNWQQVFWGSNYSKLLKIKNKYDPNGLFYCHHCVGSEYWQQDQPQHLQVLTLKYDP